MDKQRRLTFQEALEQLQIVYDDVDNDSYNDSESASSSETESIADNQRRSSRPPNPPIGGGPGQLWGPKLV